MKRVKLMLGGVVLMAVVAGSVAFKAKVAQQRCVYTHTTSTNCPFLTKSFSITATTTDVTKYATTLIVPASGVCPQTTTCINRTLIAED